MLKPTPPKYKLVQVRFTNDKNARLYTYKVAGQVYVGSVVITPPNALCSLPQIVRVVTVSTAKPGTDVREAVRVMPAENITINAKDAPTTARRWLPDSWFHDNSDEAMF